MSSAEFQSINDGANGDIQGEVLLDDLVDSNDYTCRVCLCIYTRPVKLTCRHVFCAACISGLDRDNRTCPLCREVCQVKAAPDIGREMMQKKAACLYCNKELTLVELRSHVKDCRPANPISFVPAGATSQPIPEPVNRSTFACPLCTAPNLDAVALREHCIQQHAEQRKAKVVCPVCAAMPWGNAAQLSVDFVQHVQLRHKFEYDYFVDYEKDDDAMLEEALTKSTTAL